MAPDARSRPPPRALAVKAVLFDLDGTLADSAGDLAGAINRIRRERGLAPVTVASMRPYASAGARGLLGAGMGVAPDDAEYSALREQFLAYYEAGLAETTALFEGIETLLDRLDARGLPFGIVTNKAARYTQPVVAALGLDARAGAIVSGEALGTGGDAVAGAVCRGLAVAAPWFCVWRNHDGADPTIAPTAMIPTAAAISVDRCAVRALRRTVSRRSSSAAVTDRLSSPPA